MQLIRKASANWTHGIKDGVGDVSLESGAIQNTAVTYGSRFEDARGTNPEELIAAAHASCFSTALAAQMSKQGYDPAAINTEASVRLESTGDGGFAVTQIVLDVIVKANGIGDDEFQTLAERAREGCPVSKLVGPGVNTITVNAALASAR